MMFKRSVLCLIVVASAVLGACGGSDDKGAPIKLDKLTYEGLCSSYELQVRFSGKDDHTHTIERLVPGTDTVIDSAQWGPGGMFLWHGLKCNVDEPSWVEGENLCRYEVVVVSNTDPALISKRQSIEVKCS